MDAGGRQLTLAIGERLGRLENQQPDWLSLYRAKSDAGFGVAMLN